MDHSIANLFSELTSNHDHSSAKALVMQALSKREPEAIADFLQNNANASKKLEFVESIRTNLTDSSLSSDVIASTVSLLHVLTQHDYLKQVLGANGLHLNIAGILAKITNPDDISKALSVLASLAVTSGIITEATSALCLPVFVEIIDGDDERLRCEALNALSKISQLRTFIDYCHHQQSVLKPFLQALLLRSKGERLPSKSVCYLYTILLAFPARVRHDIFAANKLSRLVKAVIGNVGCEDTETSEAALRCFAALLRNEPSVIENSEFSEWFDLLKSKIGSVASAEAIVCFMYDLSFVDPRINQRIKTWILDDSNNAKSSFVCQKLEYSLEKSISTNVINQCLRLLEKLFISDVYDVSEKVAERIFNSVAIRFSGEKTPFEMLLPLSSFIYSLSGTHRYSKTFKNLLKKSDLQSLATKVVKRRDELGFWIKYGALFLNVLCIMERLDWMKLAKQEMAGFCKELQISIDDMGCIIAEFCLRQETYLQALRIYRYFAACGDFKHQCFETSFEGSLRHWAGNGDCHLSTKKLKLGEQVVSQELAMAKKELLHLKELCAAKDSVLKATDNYCAELLVQLEQHKAEAQHLANVGDISYHELHNAKQQLSKQECVIESMTAENELMRTELKRISVEQTKELEAVKQLLAEAELKIKDQAKVLASQEKKIEKLTDNKNNLQNDLNGVKVELEKMEKMKNSAESESITLGIKLKRTEGDLSDLQNERDALKVKLDQMESTYLTILSLSKQAVDKRAK